MHGETPDCLGYPVLPWGRASWPKKKLNQLWNIISKLNLISTFSIHTQATSLSFLINFPFCRLFCKQKMFSYTFHLSWSRLLCLNFVCSQYFWYFYLHRWCREPNYFASWLGGLPLLPTRAVVRMVYMVYTWLQGRVAVK